MSVNIPIGVRCMVYSFIDLLTLMEKISKVSKAERNVIAQSKVLDQKRKLKIVFQEGVDINQVSLVYAMKLATNISMVINKFSQIDRFVLQHIMSDKKVVEKFNGNYHKIFADAENFDAELFKNTTKYCDMKEFQQIQFIFASNREQWIEKLNLVLSSIEAKNIYLVFKQFISNQVPLL